MNKKLLSVLTVILITITTTNATALVKNTSTLKSTSTIPTLAILDTALDTTIPEIKARLIGEVCILDWPSCPNGTTFMEGENASLLPKEILSNREFNHGTQMFSSAMQSNPNMNILFVRIIGNTARGDRQITTARAIPNALNWVYNNKDKYNIQGVSLSQGHHNLLSRTDYCPVNVGLIDAITKLYSVNIPTFFAAGNGRDYKKIDWPSCNQQAIAVGSTDQYGTIASYSNYDPNLLDFYDNGSLKVLLPGGISGYAAGTSVSTQVVAAKWLAVKTAKPNLTLSQIYELFAKTATPTKNATIKGGKLINLTGAING